MEYKTYKKIRDNWYTHALETYALENPPIYYVRSHTSYLVEGTVYKISPDPDFGRYCIIDEYALHAYFTPTLDIYSNIFMKLT